MSIKNKTMDIITARPNITFGTVFTTTIALLIIYVMIQVQSINAQQQSAINYTQTILSEHHFKTDDGNYYDQFGDGFNENYTPVEGVISGPFYHHIEPSTSTTNETSSKVICVPTLGPCNLSDPLEISSSGYVVQYNLTR